MAEDESAGPRAARRFVTTSIRVRVIVYALVFLVVSVLVVVDVVRIGVAAVLPVLVLAVVGFVVGLLGARMFTLSWDAMSGTVVGRIDVVGIVFLVVYAAFSIFRGRLAELWFDAPVAGVASLAALGAAMLGQTLGTASGVHRVLRIVRGRA